MLWEYATSSAWVVSLLSRVSQHPDLRHNNFFVPSADRRNVCPRDVPRLVALARDTGHMPRGRWALLPPHFFFLRAYLLTLLIQPPKLPAMWFPIRYGAHERSLGVYP